MMSFALVLGVAALSGFIALSYEIVWYRAISFVTWSSAATFGVLLGFYLLGIAYGSLRSKAYCRGRATGDPAQLRALCAYTCFANCISFLVVPMLAWSAARVSWFLPLCLLLVTLAATLLGAILPLVCHFGIAPDDRAGANLSYVYLANIIGSALGSLLTGFVLMDTLSLRAIGVLLLLMGLLLAAFLLVMSDVRGRRLFGALGGLAALSLLAVVLAPAMYDQLYERLMYQRRFAPEMRFAEVVENRSGVITVTRDGRVYGGGAYDGIFNISLHDDRNQVVRAFAVGAMHPAPREALMIGLASGSWAQVVAHLPALSHLTVVEINPGYLQLIEHHKEVASLLHNPKVTILIDDGRRWLLRHPDRTFDLIVMNTTWHWRAHATGLLSTEFFDLARSRLQSGGILYFNTTWSDDVMKTAASRFPHALRVFNCLAVSDAPIVLDRERFRQLLTGLVIEDTRPLDGSQPDDPRRLARLLSLPDTLGKAPVREGLEDRASILLRTAQARMITDDNMVPEWRHPLRLHDAE